MTFLSPWFLYALGAAAVPLLLHLVRRRRIRVMPWAAWRFLVASQQRLKRRLRIEQLVLAAVRAAIVALIVLAFARPAIRTQGASRSSDGPVHAVIALDNSASMGYEREGRTDFARAREIAETIIRKTLKQGDTVSVALISSSPTTPLKHPSHDLESARTLVRNARMSSLATDYDKAAKLCLELCAAGRAPRKEVFIITDSQRAGFGDSGAKSNGGDAGPWTRLARVARLTWVNVAQRTRPNVSVSHPVLSRAMVTPDVPVRIEARIANRTGSPIESLSARLEVDGRGGAAAPLRLRDGGVEVASFVHAFSSPGVHTGRIVVGQPDGMTADNSAWFAVRVRPTLRVLVVGSPAVGTTASDSLYVTTALAPTGASEGQTGNMTARAVATLGEASSLAGAYDVVVFAGARSVSNAEATRLRSFVSSGGGLLVFPSARGASGLAPLWSSASGPLSPVRIGERRIHAQDDPAGLDAASVAHPSLAMFRTTDESELSAARVSVSYDVGPPSPLPPPTRGGGGTGAPADGDRGGGGTGAPADGDRGGGETGQLDTMLRFADGRAAIVQAPVGEGRVIVCAFPAGIDGGDLPLKAAYVPLLHQLVSYLAASDPTHRMVTVGGSCALRFGIENAARRFVLALPPDTTQAIGGDGASRRNVPLNGVTGPDSILVRCPVTTATGPHTVSVLDASGQVRGADAYVANLAEAESDLTVAGETEIAALTGSVPMAFASDADNIERVVRANRFGSEYWSTLLLVALSLMAVEAYLARAFGRRS